MTATGTIGARSELLICADLIKKGYEVFRAVSPHSSCDLLILRNGCTERVEVKTRHRSLLGMSYPFYVSSRDADIVAVIAKQDDTVWYFDTRTKQSLTMS